MFYFTALSVIFTAVFILPTRILKMSYFRLQFFFFLFFSTVRKAGRRSLSLWSARISSALSPMLIPSSCFFLWRWLCLFSMPRTLGTRSSLAVCIANISPPAPSVFLHSVSISYISLSHAQAIQISIERLISLFLYFLFLLESFLG